VAVKAAHGKQFVVVNPTADRQLNVVRVLIHASRPRHHAGL